MYGQTHQEDSDRKFMKVQFAAMETDNFAAQQGLLHHSVAVKMAQPFIGAI